MSGDPQAIGFDTLKAEQERNRLLLSALRSVAGTADHGCRVTATAAARVDALRTIRAVALDAIHQNKE